MGGYGTFREESIYLLMGKGRKEGKGGFLSGGGGRGGCTAERKQG